MEIWLNGQIKLWERLELLLGQHATSVINGSGFRKTANKMRDVLSPSTYLSARQAEKEFKESWLDDEELYLLSEDGQAYEDLLAVVNEDG